jgi:hypothetical protein
VATRPIPFATTNGDILTTTVTVLPNGTRALVIGGNFTSVTTPDGVAHAASHLAVLDLQSPQRVLYAGRASSYVRASAVYGGVLYVVGDFTTIGGATRTRTAAIDLASWTVKAWNPGSGTRVSAVAANSRGVFYSTGAHVRAVALATATAKTIWSRPLSGGGVYALLLSPGGGALFVGGAFETVDTTTQHGLVRVSTATGAVASGFTSPMRPDTPGTHDGDEVLSFAFDAAHNRLLAGSGGSRRNMLWSLDASTGAYRGTNCWYRQSEGDVQAVALAGTSIFSGYHRNHVNTGPYPTKRFLTQWSSPGGTISSWDAGLWGNQANTDGGNNGVQAMTYEPTLKLLVVGGAFKGYGDTTADIRGTAPPGTKRQSLALFQVS